MIFSVSFTFPYTNTHTKNTIFLVNDADEYHFWAHNHFLSTTPPNSFYFCCSYSFSGYGFIHQICLSPYLSLSVRPLCLSSFVRQFSRLHFDVCVYTYSIVLFRICFLAYTIRRRRIYALQFPTKKNQRRRRRGIRRWNMWCIRSIVHFIDETSKKSKYNVQALKPRQQLQQQ